MSPRPPPDLLRFETPAGRHEVGWTGPWPPPERFGLAVGRGSGYVSVFDPESLPADVTLDDLAEVAAVGFYRRESASVIPDDNDNPHVFRGAVYRPEADDVRGRFRQSYPDGGSTSPDA